MQTNQSSLNEKHEIDLDLDKALLNVFFKFQERLSLAGISTPGPSQRALEVISKLPLARKQSILAQHSLWLSYLTPVGGSEIEIEDSIGDEKQYLKQALSFNDFYVDDEFFTKLLDDEVVEIYSSDMIQIYRSMNFYKNCGYSIPDLACQEWYTLWDRPKHAVEKMYAIAMETINDGLTTRPVPIKRHLVREIYDSGLTEPFVPRTLLVEFRHIAAVRDEKNDRVCGLIVSSRADVLAVGHSAEDISFI